MGADDVILSLAMYVLPLWYVSTYNMGGHKDYERDKDEHGLILLVSTGLI